MTGTMNSAVRAYFQSLSSIDEERYLACFAEGAKLMDPYGGRVFTGCEGLARWFVGLARTWTRFEINPEVHYAAGNRTAVKWSAEAVAKNGKQARFEGINIFTVDDDGLISKLQGYWDAAAMMAQIS